jgi:leucyl aminopeptidase
MSKTKQPNQSTISLSFPSWTRKAKIQSLKATESKSGFFFVLEMKKKKNIPLPLKRLLSNWQIELFNEKGKKSFSFDGKQGPVWVFFLNETAKNTQHQGLLDASPFAEVRDQMGAVVTKALSIGLKNLHLELQEASAEACEGALVGLELARYRFLDFHLGKNQKLPKITLSSSAEGFDKNAIQNAAALGEAMNLSRHLVNLPPGDLHPKSYSEALLTLFKDSKFVSVEIWDEKRVEKDGLGLLWATGRSAEYGPRLVRLRYRPNGSKSKRPIAFVGKGITFDSGGLDVKPSQGMRLMKKDMGGSAALAGICYWADKVKANQPCDFYLSLAENAVDGKSMRPSDVLKSHKGYLVEIDNTDAEGRLALADALSVALQEKEPHHPEMILDVATLTGAIKVGLGAKIAGLFSNRDDLAESILKAGTRKGDLCWRMPLYQPYFSGLKSNFADFTNCGPGFGGAITAALFLEKFIDETPWAHLDIYAWADSPSGAFTEIGGNGQAVQLLTEFLKTKGQA